VPDRPAQPQKATAHRRSADETTILTPDETDHRPSPLTPVRPRGGRALGARHDLGASSAPDRHPM